MSDISHKLQDLLVREAHLRLGREQILPVLKEKEAELEAVLADKPKLLAFAAKDKRVAWQARFDEAKSAVQVIANGLQQLDGLEPHLQRMIRDEIEDLLRASSPEYAQGLAACQQKADWASCVERFSARLHEFLQTLGNARNMACTGYTRATNMYSQSAVEGFVLAIAAAEKVEAEVSFANQLSDLQAAMFKESGFAGVKVLPRLPEVNYAVWVTSISGRSLVEAQIQFDAIIEATRRLYETGISELLAQGEEADQVQSSLVEDFLKSAWEQLRDEIAPLVNPEDTEESVANTERMLVAAANSSVLGRLTSNDELAAGRQEPVHQS